MPFYNTQQAVRAIIFGTRDRRAFFLALCSRYFSENLTMWTSASIYNSGAQFWSADRVVISVVVHADSIPICQKASGDSRV